MRKERKEYVGRKKEKYECRNKTPKKVNLQIRKQNIHNRATERKILTERTCINTTTKFTLST